MLFKLFSPISVILITFGLIKRKDPSKHVPLMLTAFGIDFILLLLIEFNNHAVEKVAGEVLSPAMDSFLVFHASVSTVVLLLYFALIYTGSKRLKDRTQFVKLHTILAYIFIVFKLTSFVTAFYVT